MSDHATQTARRRTFAIISHPDAGKTTHYYKSLGRYAAAFALMSDMALLTLGGALKRKEMLSARFGDILAELYFLSAVLKRWQDEGRQDADLPLVDWCMQTGFATIEARMDSILANFPNRPVAWLLRVMVLPFGIRKRGAADAVTRACADLISNPSPTRERLTESIYRPKGNDAVALVERAFRLVTAAKPLYDKMHKAHLHDWHDALKAGVIGPDEAQAFEAIDKAVGDAVAVDDFAPEYLSPQDARG